MHGGGFSCALLCSVLALNCLVSATTPAADVTGGGQQQLLDRSEPEPTSFPTEPSQEASSDSDPAPNQFWDNLALEFASGQFSLQFRFAPLRETQRDSRGFWDDTATRLENTYSCKQALKDIIEGKYGEERPELEARLRQEYGERIKSATRLRQDFEERNGLEAQLDTT